MRKAFLFMAVMLICSMSFAQSNVYFTTEITAESLVKVFQALGVAPTGNVAVKISTGESAKSNYLRPELIQGDTGIDEIDPLNVDPGTLRYNVFTIDGKKILHNASSLESLAPGIYIINGKKQAIVK